MRDRLFLAHELLRENGNCFVQIGDKNLHHVHDLLDEIFGSENFFAWIAFKKPLPQSDYIFCSAGLAGISDYPLCYAQCKKRVTFNKLFQPKPIGYNTGYLWIELPDGSRRGMTIEERSNPNLLPQKARPFFASSLSSSGYTPTCMYDFEFQEKSFKRGRAVESFGPDHAPMEQRRVEQAIDETSQPGVALERISEGKDEGKFRTSVQGFDYYNAKTGNVESGNADKIALWMLDPDYDGRSLFPHQAFFPMAGARDGRARLAKTLKVEIDATRMEAYRGTASLPFETGEHGRTAVKIVDDRGVESLKIVELA